MRIDGKEILNDEELKLILEKRKVHAMKVIQSRLNVDLHMSMIIVGTTMEELGIGGFKPGVKIPQYNDDYQEINFK